MRSVLLPCLTALSLTLLPAAPSLAQEKRQEARFDLVLRGLTIGNLAFTSVETGQNYALSGRVQTSGLAGMLRKMGYEASTQGRLTRGGFAPQRYAQTGGSGKRVTEEVLVWQGGVPRLEKQNPPRAPRENPIDPKSQRGTVDTLTAIYATLRDVPKGQECNVNLTLYDGRYRMGLQIGAPKSDAAGNVTCTGQYIRQGGFSAEEMAERVSFPFTLGYQPLGADQMRVREVAMETLWGRARLTRR